MTSACAQVELERVGIDPSAALARARARSQSRAGRKRTRSEAPSVGGEGMEVDGDGAPVAKKRIHSSKSRWVFLHVACCPARVLVFPRTFQVSTPAAVKLARITAPGLPVCRSNAPRTGATLKPAGETVLPANLHKYA